ncbi:MAG TPA: MarR family transcriptional regulator [Sporichthya sp.]|nr:MarR family transcriptional regulator [Sporichthya sp.]
MELDVVTATFLAGSALNAEALRRLHARGYDGLRIRHGYVIQHVVEGPIPIGELAGRLGVTQQAASKTVAELEQLGYLERTADPADARVRRAGLTARGRAAVGESRQIRAEIGDELAAALGPRRAATLRAAAADALTWAGGMADVRTRRVVEPR